MNCRGVEGKVFPREDVVALASQYARVNLVTDRGSAERRKALRDLMEQRFGSSALPLYVVLSSDGERVLARHDGSLGMPDALIEMLETGLERHRAETADPGPVGRRD